MRVCACAQAVRIVVVLHPQRREEPSVEILPQIAQGQTGKFATSVLPSDPQWSTRIPSGSGLVHACHVHRELLVSATIRVSTLRTVSPELRLGISPR